MDFNGVRLANSTDEDKLYDFLVKYLYAENALFPISKDKVREHIKATLTPIKGAAGIIEGENGIEASVGMVFSQVWYSDEWYMGEIWMFVHPDHRKSNKAKLLIDFSKWVSTNLKVPLVMAVASRIRLAPKIRLFQRQLTQVGASFAFGQQFDDSLNQRKFN